VLNKSKVWVVINPVGVVIRRLRTGLHFLEVDSWWTGRTRGYLMVSGSESMKVKVKVDPGICGFITAVTAVSEDSMNVDFKIGSACETIKELARALKKITPINAYQELDPRSESVVMGKARELMMKKGCCEACVVPVAACKAMYVVAGLALPKDVTLEIVKK
jgi:hypothetical protein